MYDSNIISFMSFIQSDGFNPLTVNGDSFQAIVSSEDILNKSSTIYQVANQIQSLSSSSISSSSNIQNSHHTINQQIITLLTSPWRPGQLFESLKKIGLQFESSIRSTALTEAVKISTPVNYFYFHRF